MEDLQYLPKIDRRQHIITLKDIFSYYDVTKLTGNGNLRITYGRKDKRDLAVSIFNVYIAEMFDKFVEGEVVFNFPDKYVSKMMFNTVPAAVVRQSRKAGKLKLLDPLLTNFKGIETLLRLSSPNAYYDVNVFLSENFQNKIYEKLNAGKNLLGKTNKFWNDYMDVIYLTFIDIDKKSLDRIVLFGLRKMLFFLGKGLEVFINNTRSNEYIYIGRQINKHKDVKFKYTIMTKQYIKKLRWHHASQAVYCPDRYYCLTEELYTKHLAKEMLDTVVLKKIKEECLIGKPWYKYVMKTNNNTSTFSTIIKNYDSSNDELIFIKPQK